jgi:beta-mannanase
MCQFGATTDAETEASTWWNAGSIVVMSMEMPNPYDNWQIQAPGSKTGTACPGQSGSYIAAGDSIDCAGITPTFASAMLTPGTTQNTDWNAELLPFAQQLLRLQANGIVVILRLFHEINEQGFWWAAFPGNLQAQLFTYTQNYFESQGVHNVLYEYAIVDASGTPSGYPGNSYVDLVGTDVYGEETSTSGATPGYTALVGYGKPVTFAEYNCSTQLGGASCASTYSFDTMLQDAKSYMPNLVLVNYWLGANAGNTTYPPADGVNPYWLGYMEDPYGIMQAEIPNLGR